MSCLALQSREPNKFCEVDIPEQSDICLILSSELVRCNYPDCFRVCYHLFNSSKDAEKMKNKTACISLPFPTPLPHPVPVFPSPSPNSQLFYKLFLSAFPLLMKNVQMIPTPVRNDTVLALAKTSIVSYHPSQNRNFLQENLPRASVVPVMYKKLYTARLAKYPPLKAFSVQLSSFATLPMTTAAANRPMFSKPFC